MFTGGAKNMPLNMLSDEKKYYFQARQKCQVPKLITRYFRQKSGYSNMIYRLEQNRFNEYYTKVYHRLVYDRRLSLSAKALHVGLLSKPDDWIFYEYKIAQELGVHRNTVAKLAAELEKQGYIERKEFSDEERKKYCKGKFRGKIWSVFPIPKEEYLTKQARAHIELTGDEDRAQKRDT
jgi:hypothetical protein